MTTLAALRSPPGLPLLGNLHQLDVPNLHRILERWCAELGTPFALRLGPKRVFVSDDPALLNQVLRERPERFRRVRQIEDCIAELGANGVFSREGEAWRPQRKLVMRALAPTHFRAFFPTLQSITARLQRRWHAAAARGATLDMTHELTRYTVDVTTALAFGEDPNTIEQSGDAIQDHMALIFPMLFKRINAPLPTWRWLRLPADRRLDRATAAVHAHVGGLIERARARLREDPAPRHLLDALLVARDEPGSGLTDADVHANVQTLLLAGEDTTAHTLAWTLFQLAQHPAWRQRLQAEADAVLGSAAVCAAHDDVRRLDAFEACATEATRLKPIVPLLFFEPNLDVELGGVALTAGTPLFFVLRPAMLDARRFVEPLQFRPERWLRADDGRRDEALDTHAYLQFGAGPRVCPGRGLAGVEIRLVLSMLARSFDYELAVDPASIREVAAFTMMPSAMPLRLSLRA